jgi:hypothetical protein
MTILLDRRLDVLCKRLSENVMGAALCANEIIAIVHELNGDGGVRTVNGVAGHPDEKPPALRPLLDESTLSVVWNGIVLPLGHTQAFWLLARLTRSVNQYVTHVDLLQEIWDDEFTDAATLRAAVRRLRKKLRGGGMSDLASAIVGHSGRYMLNLNHAQRHTEVTGLSR